MLPVQPSLGDKDAAFVIILLRRHQFDERMVSEETIEVPNINR